MPRPRSYRTEAVVLRSVPAFEAAIAVTVFSRDLGKLRAVVRGARKPTSKLSGHLQPLNRVELGLARSSRPGGTDTVTQAQMLEGFPSLKGDLEAVSKGIYLAELLEGFSAEGVANPELYSLLIDTLRYLDHTHDANVVLRYFELQLLNHSGFMPELYRCVSCREELVAGKHVFSPEIGGTLCLRCNSPGGRIMHLSVQAVKALRFLDRAALSEVPKLRVQAGLRREIESILSATLRYWLDRDIRSKRFMEHVERLPKAGVPSSDV